MGYRWNHIQQLEVFFLLQIQQKLVQKSTIHPPPRYTLLYTQMITEYTCINTDILSPLMRMQVHCLQFHYVVLCLASRIFFNYAFYDKNVSFDGRLLTLYFPPFRTSFMHTYIRMYTHIYINNSLTARVLWFNTS